MKKIWKISKALAWLIKKPSLINRITESEEVFKNHVKKNYQSQNGLPRLDIVQFFNGINISLKPTTFLGGGSSAMDLALLVLLCKKYNLKEYFEIGTWRGESVAMVAPWVINCTTMNLPAEILKSQGADNDYINQIGYFSNTFSNVKQIYADSMTFDYPALNQKFDLVFIDGDHHYQSVVNDTKNIFKHLVKENTIVVWHDYAYDPEAIRWEVLAGILDGCPVNLHHRLFHVSNTRCAIYLGNHENPPLIKPNSEQLRNVFEISIRTLIRNS